MPSRKVGKNEDAFTLLQRGGGGEENKIALFGTKRMTCLAADKLATAAVPGGGVAGRGAKI